MKNSLNAMEKSRSIPSQMRGSHGKKEHGQTSSVQIKISGGLGENRNTREKLPLPIF
jgi:hypothetical protein